MCQKSIFKKIKKDYNFLKVTIRFSSTEKLQKKTIFIYLIQKQKSTHLIHHPFTKK